MKVSGIITNVITNKYFGFIRYNDVEYFFHRADFKGFWEDLSNDFKNNKHTGNKIVVTFTPGDGPKGPRASFVEREDWPNQSV